MAVAALAMLGLSAALPSYEGALPAWLALGSAAALWVVMAAASQGHHHRSWLQAERAVVLGVAVIILGAELSKLASVIHRILSQDPGSSGIVLLSSSVAIWCNNVFAFSLIYWQVDRGGPLAREGNAAMAADWRFFEENDAATTERGWRPAYVDYLYLAFSTATAFSSTDTGVPLTGRAKLLSMLQAMLSLVTMVVVASRAINVLGD